MTKDSRKIPLKNYIYLLLIIITSIAILYYLYLWFVEYNNEQRKNSIMNEVMQVINVNELDTYLIENKNAVIYISRTNDKDIRKYEKKLKKLIEKENITNKILYMDVTNQVSESKKYEVNNQQVKIPAFFFQSNTARREISETREIKRGGETFDVSVTPVKLGVYGVGVQLGMLEYPSPFRQFAYVWEMSFRSLRNISISLANKLNLTEQQSTVSARNLSGPLGIVSMMYKTAHYSLITGIYFVVFVSFALAIFNLLPLPVLDGGHIFFAAIELIFRHPVPKWLVKNLSLIFIVLLFSAMALLTMLDVMRLVPPEEVELKEPVIVSIDNPEPPADAAEGSETEAQK